MSAAISYDRNRSCEASIRRHLDACADAFTPPLGLRVTIPDYAAKLAARAERFEAWLGADLIGLVAIYIGPSGGDAFVSNVSVAPDFARQGIGRRLLIDAIHHADACCARMVLEVDRRAVARRLYRDAGFTLAGRDGDTLQLERFRPKRVPVPL